MCAWRWCARAGAAMTDATPCIRCGQDVQDWDQWFEEPCPQERPDLRDYGHQLSQEQIWKLPFRDHPEHQEMKQ